MAASPQYAATPRVGLGAVSAANTNRDGTGTLVTIFTAGANGSRLNFVIVKALATTTAGTVRLFVHDGTTAYLIEEEAVTANTASASNPAFGVLVTFNGGLVLPTGYSLRASTHNAEPFHVAAFGGDL